MLPPTFPMPSSTNTTAQLPQPLTHTQSLVAMAIIFIATSEGNKSLFVRCGDTLELETVYPDHVPSNEELSSICKKSLTKLLKRGGLEAEDNIKAIVKQLIEPGNWAKVLEGVVEDPITIKVESDEFDTMTKLELLGLASSRGVKLNMEGKKLNPRSKNADIVRAIKEDDLKAVPDRVFNAFVNVKLTQPDGTIKNEQWVQQYTDVDSVNNLKLLICDAHDIPPVGIKLFYGGKSMDTYRRVVEYSASGDIEVVFMLSGLQGGASKRGRAAEITDEEKLDALKNTVQGQEFHRVDIKRIDRAQIALEKVAQLLNNLEVNPQAITDTVELLDTAALKELLIKFDNFSKNGATRVTTLSKLANLIFPEVDELANIADVCQKARANLLNRFNTTFVHIWHKINQSDTVHVPNLLTQNDPQVRPLHWVKPQ